MQGGRDAGNGGQRTGNWGRQGRLSLCVPLGLSLYLSLYLPLYLSLHLLLYLPS